MDGWTTSFIFLIDLFFGILTFVIIYLPVLILLYFIYRLIKNKRKQEKKQKEDKPKVYSASNKAPKIENPNRPLAKRNAHVHQKKAPAAADENTQSGPQLGPTQAQPQQLKNRQQESSPNRISENDSLKTASQVHLSDRAHSTQPILEDGLEIIEDLKEDSRQRQAAFLQIKQKKDLRRAIIAKEILDPPKAIQSSRRKFKGRV